MPRLTDQGLQKINDLAQHYGVSADAVMTLLRALLSSKGTMAQFDHRELGGAGQWMAQDRVRVDGCRSRRASR